MWMFMHKSRTLSLWWWIRLALMRSHNPIPISMAGSFHSYDHLHKHTLAQSKHSAERFQIHRYQLWNWFFYTFRIFRPSIYLCISNHLFCRCLENAKQFPLFLEVFLCNWFFRPVQWSSAQLDSTQKFGRTDWLSEIFLENQIARNDPNV